MRHVSDNTPKFVRVASATMAELQPLMRCNAVPLLTCLDPDEMRFREEVLRWHGLAAAEPDAALPERAVPLMDDKHLIVSLCPEFNPLLRHYAAWTGRAFVSVNNISSGSELPDVVSASTAVFVGRPRDFPVGCAGTLPKSVKAAFLIAQDVATLSFVLAKQIAPGPVRQAALTIDMIWGTIQSDEDTPRCLSDQDARNQLRDAVTDGDWQRVVIHAHGESGHLNLGTIVLCGLYGGEEEERFDGHAISGCRVRAGKSECKKLPAGVADSRPVKHLRTAELMLYSCHSFVTNGALYPSNSSCIVAALEGYASAVAGPDRETRAPADWPMAARRQSSAYTGLERAFFLSPDAASAGWDQHMILCGDPWYTQERCSEVAARDTADATPSAPERGDDLRRWCNALSSRHRAMQFVVDALENCSAPETRAEDEAVRGQLNAILHRLFQCQLTARRLVNEPLSQSEFLARVDAVQSHSRKLEAVWEEFLATALEERWLAVPFIDVLNEVAPHSNGLSKSCARCDTANPSIQLRIVDGDNPILVTYHCRVCGPGQFSTRCDGPMQAKVPLLMKAGAKFSLNIEGHDLDRPSSFVLRLRDKARNEDILTKRFQATGGQVLPELDLPMSIRPDLHSIRLFRVQGLHLEMSQTRFESI